MRHKNLFSFSYKLEISLLIWLNEAPERSIFNIAESNCLLLTINVKIPKISSFVSVKIMEVKFNNSKWLLFSRAKQWRLVLENVNALKLPNYMYTNVISTEIMKKSQTFLSNGLQKMYQRWYIYR